MKGKKKRIANDKPDSVGSRARSPYCGLSFIYHPYRYGRVSAYPPRLRLPEGKPIERATLLRIGIGVYMAFQSTRFIRLVGCPISPCALTARFPPYRAATKTTRRLFSATLSVSRRSVTPFVKWCGALHCPDFPHFYFCHRQSRTATTCLRCDCKDKKK